MKAINWLIGVLISVFVSTAFASLLADAAERGDLAEVKKLLDSGEKVVVMETGGDDNYRNSPAVIAAAKKGHPKIIRALLDQAERSGQLREALEGPELNWGKPEYPPLMFAIVGGHEETVKELLKRGAKVTKSYPGFSSLIVSAKNTSPQMLELIRNAALENRVKFTDPFEIRAADGDSPGSYNRDLAALGSKEERTAAVLGATKNPPTGPGKIISEYLD